MNPIEVYKILKKKYPEPKPELKYKNIYELYVSVLLSAQCTDKRVNLVTPVLFGKYTGFKELSKASFAEVKTIIKSCGLYRGKAKNLINGSKIIYSAYKDKLPSEREELEKLPGIGRKSAGVILAVGFGIPAFPVDTHVGRLCYRLGLTKELDPRKVEADITNSLSEKYWTCFHHCLIFHGRRICKAQSPLCNQCPLDAICPRAGVSKK